MNYKTFEKLILELENVCGRHSKLYELGVDLLNYEEPLQKINSILMFEIFGEEGKDWIDWYLYERVSPSGEILKAWDENNNEICYNIFSLWETVKEYITKCHTE
jgi:hypothetical protein